MRLTCAKLDSRRRDLALYDCGDFVAGEGEDPAWRLGTTPSGRLGCSSKVELDGGHEREVVASDVMANLERHLFCHL